MDFDFTEEQQRFRQEVRNFCESEPWGQIIPDISEGYSSSFYHKIAEKGWLGMNLPRKYGGAERPYIDTAIFTEEMHYQRAPEIVRTWYDIVIGTAIYMVNKFSLKTY